MLWLTEETMDVAPKNVKEGGKLLQELQAQKMRKKFKSIATLFVLLSLILLAAGLLAVDYHKGIALGLLAASLITAFLARIILGISNIIFPKPPSPPP